MRDGSHASRRYATRTASPKHILLVIPALLHPRAGVALSRHVAHPLLGGALHRSPWRDYGAAPYATEIVRLAIRRGPGTDRRKQQAPTRDPPAADHGAYDGCGESGALESHAPAPGDYPFRGRPTGRRLST